MVLNQASSSDQQTRKECKRCVSDFRMPLQRKGNRCANSFASGSVVVEVAIEAGEGVEIEAATYRSEEASVGVEVIAKSFSFKQPRGNVLRSVKPLQMGAAE